jgi:flagellar basal body-associated protein FliL
MHGVGTPDAVSRDDMADEPEEPAGGGKNRLVLILVGINVLVALVAVAAVAMAVMGGGGGDAAEPPEPDPREVGPLVACDGLVINLDESDGTSYLRAAFQLELTGEEEVELVTARLVPIRNAVLLHLSSLRVEDTQGRDNRERLLVEVRTLANEVLGDELVRNVYYTEFVVQ